MHATLDNKVIVIVGGTAGLGLSAAHACIAAGGHVVVVGRDAERGERAERELGDDARFFGGDAADPDVSPHAIALAEHIWGGFDGLYHVAGGSGRRRGDGPLHELSDEGWDYTLRLNLDSLFYSNRAAVQALRRRGHGGSVLNMTSVLADRPAPRYFATHAYAATKAAAVGLTQATAAYYARDGIRCNAVAPALVDTALTQRARGDEQIMQYVATKQPLDGGRIGVPEDLDAAVVFLLSEAARFVTGQVLRIDGGWSITDGQYAAPPTDPFQPNS